jgi:hypothetical protein
VTVLSLGEFLWSLLVIFFFVIYFMMLFQVIVDVFRRDDIGGGKKAAWLIFLLIVPLLSLVIYMLSHGDDMAKRNIKQAQQQRADFDDYVRTTAVSSDPAEQIAKAKGLLDSGAITQAEFDQLKAKALTA